MESVISVIHVIIAVVLVFLVLIQDSKGGGLGMMSGGGSGSILGTTGADNLVVKMTRWVALAFAFTSVILTIWNAEQGQSVLESAPVVNTPPAASDSATAGAAAIETEAAPAEENTEESPGNN
tara:strand:- start:25306 stop:25674 length:369 start_codon:yes stop_codon:yes gene_type:complete